MNRGKNTGYDIAVAVLIGGKSERMGSPKENTVIPGDGRTFLERISSEVDITCLDKYLSVRSGQEANIPGSYTGDAHRHGYTIVTDIYDGIGPIGAVDSVLKQARMDGHDAVLMLACDMYRYDHSEIQSICGRYHGEDILFARTRIDGMITGPLGSDAYALQPLASIYSVNVLDAVKAQIGSGDYRIRNLTEYVGNVGFYDSNHPEFYENRNTPFWP